MGHRKSQTGFFYQAAYPDLRCDGLPGIFVRCSWFSVLCGCYFEVAGKDSLKNLVKKKYGHVLFMSIFSRPGDIIVLMISTSFLIVMIRFWVLISELWKK